VSFDKKKYWKKRMRDKTDTEIRQKERNELLKLKGWFYVYSLYKPQRRMVSAILKQY